MVAAEPTSHPLLNTSCVGATRPQQLSGSLSEQFDVTARSPTTTKQPDRSNIDLPIIPWGLGASQCLYVEVCGRVARSSGDIYTTQTSSHLCPTVSAQLWTRWLTSAIYCFSSWVNSIRKILESGTLCSDLSLTDVWQIKGGEKNHRCVIVRCRATVRLRNSFSVPWHRFTKSLERLIRCSKISHSCSGVFRLWRNTINIISIDFHLLSDLFSPKSNIFP